MTVVITKKLSEEDIAALLSTIKGKPKLFDTKKYFGKASVPGDPLKVQQQLRDE